MFSRIKKSKSELRYDTINKDWIVVAEGRGKRPEDFKNKKEEQAEDSSPCVFCNYFTHSNTADKNFLIVPNKFPAFLPPHHSKIRGESRANKDNSLKSGNALFKTMPSVGFHEVVIFNDHSKQLTDFSISDWEGLFSAYQQKYLELSKERVVSYISIFHNHGKMAGASLNHPHSQIIAIPFFDITLEHSINSAKEFFFNKSQCLFCSMNRAEKVAKSRIILENNSFLAVCPFASKVNFEVVISPKKHLPYFEKITKEEKSELAQVFQVVLKKISYGLNNPDYNFYLHTSPCDDKDYLFYHWHFTIMPRVNVWAGFELGAGIEIITMLPEKAAEYLKNVKI
ncbi:MAG: galactose-1-phosphate uridylyltransferase [Candidatus Pacebacteria bacterium]|nr:galactose-1-phosphate uridylyltransferase [Candidatus Paceibacterota bacterium]